MNYILIDWCGNHLHPDREFDSFEDGWGFIRETYTDENDSYDDLFIVPTNQTKELGK
jgi:hypothetical protein